MYKSSVFQRYIISFLIIAIIPMVTVYFFTYNMFQNEILQQNIAKEQQILNQYMNRVNVEYENIERIAYQIAYNYMNSNGLPSDQFNISSKENNNLLNLNNPLISTYKYIQSIYVYNEKDSSLFAYGEFFKLESFYDTEWIDTYKDSIKSNDKKGHIWIDERNINAKNNYSYMGSTIILPILIGQNQKAGAIVINFNFESLLADYFRPQSLTGAYYVISPTNKIIYGQNTLLINSQMLLKKNYVNNILNLNKNHIAIQTISNRNNWRYIAVVPKNKIQDALKALNSIVYTLLIIVLVAIVWVSITVSRKMYMPINEILKMIKPISKNIKGQDKEKDRNELSIIKKNLIEYIKSQEDLKERFNETDTYIYDKKIKSLLRNEENILDDDVWKEVFKLDDQYFCVIIFENFTREYKKQGSFYECINPIIESVIKQDCIMMELDFNRVGCILNFDTKVPKEDIRKQVIDAVGMILDQDSPYNYVVVAIGDIVNHIRNIHKSYFNCIEALGNRILFDSKILLYSPNLLSDRTVSFEYPIDTQIKIISAIKEKNIEKCEEYIKTLICEIKNANIPIECINGMLSSIREILFGIPLTLGYTLEEIFYNDPVESYQKYIYLLNINEIEGYFIDISKQIVKGLLLKLDNKNLELVNAIKEYIVENIEQNFTQPEIAKQYGVSQSFLSAIFKQETGQNYVKYVQMIKIEFAKKLLKETDMTNKDISEKVGYFKETSFYAVFKKHEGITPSQYRNTFKKTL